MTDGPTWGSDGDLAAVVELLREVFPDPERFTIERLRWSYRNHPLGPAAVGRDHDRDGRQVGNYALVPLRLTDGRRSLLLGLGIDLAVSPSARGSGAFRHTVETAYAEAKALGMDGILGIANAQSAPRMVKAMGWRHLPSLPTRLVLPVSAGRGRSFDVARVALDDPDVRSALGSVDAVAGPGWGQRWDAILLRWRVEMPMGDYRLHLLPDCVAISTTDKVAGLPVAVLLKVLPTGADRVRGGRVAARVARSHRTPLVVHWGVNSDLRLPGIRLPKRLQPSPLEVVLHLFDDGALPDDPTLGRFELLDLDAY